MKIYIERKKQWLLRDFHIELLKVHPLNTLKRASLCPQIDFASTATDLKQTIIQITLKIKCQRLLIPKH